ncbi:MAG TPA: hypothetical protein DCS43_10070 [Verrucomicrobia bacterium]|nr:hypothetical protein [Verrucomicrobiota bacterium]
MVLMLIIAIIGRVGCSCSESKKPVVDVDQERVNAMNAENAAHAERARVAALESISAQQALEEKLRQFAISRTPELWRVLQQLRSLHKDTSEQLLKLQSALESVGRDADQDLDYQRFGRKRNELGMLIRKLENELENAYIAYVKFETAPHDAVFSNQVAVAYQSGMATAREATARFNELKDELLK